MIKSSCIYRGHVIHKRFKPKKHFFKYKVFSLLIDLSEIDQLEKKAMKESLPSYSVGDTVVVSQQIVEGKKSRIQKYEGMVIKKKNAALRSSVTVRKLVDGSGVEKTFLVHSPLIKDIEVKKQGKVRRAKLYYIRERIGKKATTVKAKQTTG